MRTLTLTALCLTVAHSASLAGMPPERYDHAYKGETLVHALPYGKAGHMCRKLSKRYGLPAGSLPRYGCSFLHDDGLCEVVISYSAKEPRMRSNVLRHEIAHCNGWPGHHPDAR